MFAGNALEKNPQTKKSGVRYVSARQRILSPGITKVKQKTLNLQCQRGLNEMYVLERRINFRYNHPLSFC
jgi:hypothetical protein